MNLNKLRGKIAEAGLTLGTLAQKMGLNSSTLFRKLNGKTEFTRREIISIKEILDLDSLEVDLIFFAD